MPEAEFLPDGYDASELNDRILSATTRAFAVCFFVGLCMMVVPVAFGIVMNPRRATSGLFIAMLAVGVVGLLACIVASIPISRHVARRIVRQELARLGVRICTRCGYDCRGTQSPVCTECGSAVALVR